MGVDFSTMVYLFCYDFYARPIEVFPHVSQPGLGSSYIARGIWNSDGIEFPAAAGSLVSDQRTICDIKEDEFPIMPMQGDQIYFPVDDNGPANGPFEITDLWTNAGGETTLALKRVEAPAPPPPLSAQPINVVPLPLARPKPPRGNAAFRPRIVGEPRKPRRRYI